MSHPDQIFTELDHTANALSLVSRNHHDQLIGIDYANDLESLNSEQLENLTDSWRKRLERAKKERFSAQLMILQLCLLFLIATFLAWLVADSKGLIISIFGMAGLLLMLDFKRVDIAKSNVADIETIYEALLKAHSNTAAVCDA